MKNEINEANLKSGRIVMTGWTQDAEGVNVWDYFDRDGKYLGADEFGTEPTFEDGEQTDRKYFVTTKDDMEMGNTPNEIEATSPGDAAKRFGEIKASDYWDEPEQHVGQPVTIIVTDEDGRETRIKAEYV